MTSKNILIALIVAVLAYVAYRWYSNRNEAPKVASNNSTSTPVATTNNTAATTTTVSTATPTTIGKPIPDAVSNTTTTAQQQTTTFPSASKSVVRTPSAIVYLDEINEAE